MGTRVVAVTGAAGLLGAEVTKALVAAGYSVTAIDRTECSAPPGGRFVRDDLSDFERVQAILAGADAVVHCAALAHLGLAREDILFNVNVQSACNVIFASEAAGVTRLVYASSQSALGLAYAPEVLAPDALPVDETHPCRPREGYALSKLVGEQLCELVSRRSLIVTRVLRFPVIWTPTRFKEHVSKRLSSPAQAAKSQWSYIDVRDAARAVLLALEAKGREPYGVYNIAAPWPFEIGDAAATLSQVYGDIPRRPGFQPGDAAFDVSRAWSELGFVAAWRWTADMIIRDP